MKKILGLDLGTNSIGWSVINAECDHQGNTTLKSIESAGSRIIPMDAAALTDFDKGNSKSLVAERTAFRGVRRIRERHLLRRERLHRVLALMNFLPQHYVDCLTRYGKFASGVECKFPWKKNSEGKGYEFLFQSSFQEMLEDFRRSAPQWMADGQKIPYDWTLYYLRTKALTSKISREELAWILLNFNQKRGYYQLRGEDEEISSQTGKLEEYYALRVESVEDSGDKRGKDTWYDVTLENGMVYHFASRMKPDWVGKTKEFIVTTSLNPDGTPKLDKDGTVKRSFRMPKEDDWNLIKKKTEKDIEKSGETVGEYIYHALLSNPRQKIRGKLVRTVERKFYKDELRKILEAQLRFHDELRDRELYRACVEELYPSNDAYRNSIAGRDFIYLFVDDILFYQRPLKTKKSLISNCPYESHVYLDKRTGEPVPVPVKCIAKSHPLFQEFRLWHFLQNLRIYRREDRVDGRLVLNLDVTDELLGTEDARTALFDWLNERPTVEQDKLLAFLLGKSDKKRLAAYRWNYVEDKKYPGNETRAQLLKYLKQANVGDDFLTREKEEALWHILYSVEDKVEITKALRKYADRYALSADFVEVFAKFPPFPKDYGAYSAKAIKKLLPLMRMGHYWNEADIDANTRQRIAHLVDGEWDESIVPRVREKASGLTDVTHFRGLPLWLACYVVYGRHSEAKSADRWTSPADIDDYLKQFRQHSLRNPVVEQVVLETLRVVRDVWKRVGQIDEIHIELGREMKNPADKRAEMTRRALENEQTNLRIKALLMEFRNPEFGVENVRPYSQSQQEILRIYEEEVLMSEPELPDDIAAILKKLNGNSRPSTAEVMRYKCWLEQKYCSPYTGDLIPLNRLFTPAYEIEHVIPQSRYFDDSFSNKVICESEVNKLKGNLLGYEFIKKHHGEVVTLSYGRQVTLLSVEGYEKFVHEHYARNRAKMRKLLMDDIPEEFIERQLNDSRYISRLVTSLLSNVVREEGEAEATSKNVIVCTGGVTDRLKRDWGITDVWNKIVLSRFQRLDEMDGGHAFVTLNTNGQPIPAMPLEYQRGFNKKRIDHRHHAMDAIVIACATRNMVNYLNNESARKGAKVSRTDLQRLLCTKSRVNDKGDYRWIVNKPWPTFTQDVYEVLCGLIASFKQNLRVINKTKNHYRHYEDGRKVTVRQTKGDSWAIRKPMHKDTYYGEINLRKVETVSLKKAVERVADVVEKDLKAKLRELLRLGYDVKRIAQYFDEHKEVWADIDLSKIKVYYFTKQTDKRYFASRKSLDVSFTRDTIEKKVADTAIQKILLRHLENYGDDAEQAFSPDGIAEMNANIVQLNNGRLHQPIYKVRIYEQANKFAVGQMGNKASKFVEAAKGTNLFFAVYETTVTEKDGSRKIVRSFDTIPLNVVIERQKQGLPSVPNDVNGNAPKFVLSPTDLVYVPTEEELRERRINMPLDKGRIYKMVSASKKQCYFLPVNVAVSIVDKYEYSALNKMERALTGEMIKDVCLPIKVDRLGTVTEQPEF